MSYICRQPNGLLCRFSTVVDTVTDYNMTEEEYIEMCAERARKEARNIIDNHLIPYERIDEDFVPNNMTVKEFRKIKKEMESEEEDTDQKSLEEWTAGEESKWESEEEE